MDLLDYRSWIHSSKLALISGQLRLTYLDVFERASRIASGLTEAGASGHNVAFLLKNGPDLICSYLACFESGATAVPLNPKSTPPELEFYLAKCNIGLLIVEEDNLDQVRATVNGLATERIVAVQHFASSGPTQRSDVSFPDKPAVIFHTSGSTKLPKGVVHTRKSLVSSIEPFFSEPVSSQYGVSSEEFVYLNVASIADTVGIIHILWTLFAGGSVVILETFHVERYVEALERYSPTHTTLFLPQAVKLFQHNAVERRHFENMRMLCIAGDKTPVELIHRCLAVSGVVPLIGYGLTESFVIALNLSLSPDKFGSMGTPLPSVDIQIVDENNHPVPPGTIGEIIVRSPQNMIGYWRQPTETKRALLPRGWLKTGDYAYQDKEGYLWFTERKKQIIIRGGENISPREIEAVLYSHPAIKLAAVIGIPHPEQGEVPRAFVVLNGEQKVSTSELLAFLRTRLIYYKVPDEIEFVDHLPVGRTGKVDRRKLRDSLVERRDYDR
jgi:long-chain acyl-CoA synthetase